MKAKNINKIKDPRLDIQMEPFPRITVELVDKMVEIAKKNESTSHVQTSGDWDTIINLYKLFKTFYPKTEADFIKQMKDFRKDEYAHGIGGDKGARIQHQMEVPKPLFSMIMAIFPDQQWDKKFVKDLAKVLPQLSPVSDGY